MTSSDLESAGYSIFTAILLSRNPGGDFGGYQMKYFTNPIETICVFCRQIPRDPYRAACGHIFCRDCLYQNILCQEQVCVQCNLPVRREECHPDSNLDFRISQSPISCPYSRSCRWVGHIEDVAPHFSKCSGVSPLLRSWMQSIQARISAVAADTGRMEGRVSRLTEQVEQMGTKCDAAGYEHERQLGWIGNQLDYLEQNVLGSPRKYDFTNAPHFDHNPPPPVHAPPPIHASPFQAPPPLHAPPFQAPPPLHAPPFQAPAASPSPKYGFDIDESEMTKSLAYDLQGPQVVEMRVGSPRPRRNVSNYETFVRQDTGELPFPSMEDAVFREDPPFRPDRAPAAEAIAYTKKCLYCNQPNAQESQKCFNCGRIL